MKESTNQDQTAPKIAPMTMPNAKKIIPIDLSDLELNTKEYKFIAAYCSNGFVPEEAYDAAGYKSRTNKERKSRASGILNRGKVQEGIRRFMDSIIQPYKEKLEWFLLEVQYRRAFYKPNIFYYDDGELKPLSEIPEEWQVCIDGVEKRYFGKDADKCVTSYKIANRDNALRALTKILEAYEGVGAGEGKVPESARERLDNIFNGGGKGDVINFPRKAGGK